MHDASLSYLQSAMSVPFFTKYVTLGIFFLLSEFVVPFLEYTELKRPFELSVVIVMFLFL